MGSVETEESELQKRIQGINLNTEILDSLVVEHLKGKVCILQSDFSFGRLSCKYVQSKISLLSSPSYLCS